MTQLDASPLQERRRELAAVGILLALVLAHFALLELAKPFYFLWDDNAGFFLPSYVLNAETVFEHGELPHVNPHQYLGHAYIGSGQTGALYPPVYLAFALTRLVGDARGMIDLLAIVHFLLAALGMYALLRAFGVARTPAVLASLLWVSFPFSAQVARNWIFVSFAAAYLPWSLLLTERLLEVPTARRALELAVVKALLFYQGYVQYAVLAALFEGVYMLWRVALRPDARRRFGRGAATYGAALLATGALAAPILVPMFEAKMRSAYRAGALSLEEFLSNALDPVIFLRAQIFDMEPEAIHLSSGGLFYVGVPVLLAALLLLGLHLRGRAARVETAPFVAALLTSATAFLLSTEAAGILHAVPLLGSFRWPFKGFLIVLLFLTLAVGGLAGLAWRRDCRRRRGLATAMLVLGVVGNVFVVHVWDAPFGPTRLRESVAEYRAEVAARFPGGKEGMEKGRIVSMWMSHGEPEIERLLVQNFATLAGAYHLGGYDPLIAKLNLELAVGLEYSNIFRYELTRESLDYLSSWSVRWLLVPVRPNFPGIFAEFPELRRVYQGDGMEIWENTAALPFAYFLGDEGKALPVTWGPSGARVRTNDRAGVLRLQIAPLEHYRWRVDGFEMGTVVGDADRHVLLEIPAGTREVELSYVDLPMRRGLHLSEFFALLVLVGVLWRRRRNKS